MPANVSQMESPLGGRSKELSLKLQELIAKVNDPTIPNDAFKQDAILLKLELDAYEDDSNSVDDSFRSSSLELQSYHDQEFVDDFCQERQVPTLPQGCATPLTFDVATSQNPTTGQFSQTTSDDALTEETKHLLDTESPAKISPTGFENVDPEDEPEALVKVGTAQAITLQRLPAKEAGPYKINGAHNKTNFGYDPGVSRETQHRPGKQLRSECISSRTDIDGEATQTNESYKGEDEDEQAYSPTARNQVRRRRNAGKMSGADTSGNTASMPRFSLILPTKTDSTLFSDEHIIRLTLLPPTPGASSIEHTGHPAIMLPGPRDSTFLYDADVFHISLWGEPTPERQDIGTISCFVSTAADSGKRDSLFLWKDKGDPKEIPVSESCWEAASRLCRVQTAIGTSDEQELQVYSDLRQLGDMIERSKWSFLTGCDRPPE